MDSLGIQKKSANCQVCFKSLSSKQNLKQHMNIHTGEKPFKCSYSGCNSSYKHASQLSNHRVLHQQYRKAPTSSFDDIHAFIKILVQVLEQNAVISNDPVQNHSKVKKMYLPCIQGPQIGVMLPNFDEYFSK